VLAEARRRAPDGDSPARREKSSSPVDRRSWRPPGRAEPRRLASSNSSGNSTRARAGAPGTTFPRRRRRSSHRRWRALPRGRSQAIARWSGRANHVSRRAADAAPRAGCRALPLVRGRQPGAAFESDDASRWGAAPPVCQWLLVPGRAPGRRAGHRSRGPDGGSTISRRREKVPLQEGRTAPWG